MVIPSLPGYGFSGKPTATGWDPIRIARAWIVLMKRLGYTRFVAQGGDWGAPSPSRWRCRRRRGCSASTPTCPATVPADIAKALDGRRARRRPASRPTSGARTTSCDFFYKHGLGYALEMANRPQTLYAIADSPVGLAAWMLDHDAAQPGADRARLRRAAPRA